MLPLRLRVQEVIDVGCIVSVGRGEVDNYSVYGRTRQLGIRAAIAGRRNLAKHNSPSAVAQRAAYAASKAASLAFDAHQACCDQCSNWDFAVASCCWLGRTYRDLIEVVAHITPVGTDI